MAETLHFETAPEDAIRGHIDRAGWVGEPVLAAGQLRQGKAPSTLAMVTGAALIELVRPRRSKQLPRHFVLAVGETKVVAFKASGGSRAERPVDRRAARLAQRLARAIAESRSFSGSGTS